jgi:LPXTG-site transpeptidase (sortase) family protein
LSPTFHLTAGSGRPFESIDDVRATTLARQAARRQASVQPVVLSPTPTARPIVARQSVALVAGQRVVVAVPTPETPRARPSTLPAATWLPISHLAIPRIGLDWAVVPAPLIDQDGNTTWQVPSFQVGHAEFTAGAGQPGNAVLIGHLQSLHAGSVFSALHLARIGDSVLVSSSSRTFDYHVVDVSVVSRADLSVLNRTALPTATLITCAGAWIPAIDDYSERLIVRAVLGPSP